MKDSTRAKSSIQEKRIAKAMGGRQVVGSGSTPFLKGDVVVDTSVRRCLYWLERLIY